MNPPPPEAAPGGQSACTFPRLEVISPLTTHTFLQPTKRINHVPDVARFLVSKAYRDIGIFVLQLTRALCPRKTSPPTAAGPTASHASRSSSPGSGAPARTFPLSADRKEAECIERLRALLGKAEALIDEAPPDPGPRRFGNVSFKKWYGLLEEKVDELLEEHVSEDVLGFGKRPEEDGERKLGPLVELKAYFLGGFGSSQRLDYGTGHELSFLAFLACIWKLGGFEKDGNGEDIERSIVLGVFERYLQVIRRLILTYTLEPAGSHGVWGLDDHSFMPYIFGSAQLTRPIAENEAMPREGSVRGAPKPADMVNSASVEQYRSENMYFSAIGFINHVKKGPFWEHSPMLFDISGIKDGWGKINKGMIKMYNAEVLSKFPVVQHFPFGSLFSWDVDAEAAASSQSVHMANQPVATSGAGTRAPWGQGSASGGLGAIETLWSSSGSSAPSLPRGGPPDTGPPPPLAFPRGEPGTASNQFSVTKAPWAK